jgi:hypothetical protein
MPAAGRNPGTTGGPQSISTRHLPTAMNPLLYKVIHLAGVLGLFTSFGAILASSGACETCRKGATIMHGISLLLLLGAGFGMLAKIYQNQFYGWVIAKLVIWVLLGVAPVLAKRKVVPNPVILVSVLLLGIAAAYLGIMKPL